MVNTSTAKGTVCVRAKDKKTLEEIYYLMNNVDTPIALAVGVSKITNII